MSRFGTQDYFGLKIAWEDFQFFKYTGLDALLFAGSRFIYIDRKDDIAQAVSLFHAVKSNIFHYRTETEQTYAFSDDAYDYDHILRIRNSILKNKLHWKQYFQDHGIATLDLVYEDFKQDVSEAASAVLEFLDIRHATDWSTLQSDFIRVEKRYYNDWVQRTRDKLHAGN